MKNTETSIQSLESDDAILRELGARLARHRINADLTQAELAGEAGLSKRTVERIEAGGSSQTMSLIRIMRVLDLLPGLESAVPPSGPGPMELLERRGRPRQRVRASGTRRDGAAVSESPVWTWGDEPA